MSNDKHVRNSFYNGSRIDDIEANENRGPAGPQGLPGFSPRASVTQTENGARIIVTDKNGTTYADITNGRNGVDGNNGSNGFSPIAEVAEVEDGAQLTVTDNRGTTTALIRNGERGERGEQGIQGPAGPQGTAGPEGKQGIQGPAGADGFSPTVEVTEITNGHTVTITDKDGFHSFEVTNGKDGQNGQNGENGQNGSDGAAATISIGNVETLPEGSSAYVVNTGNENAAVFDFGIPQGIQGPKGEQGIQGIQGEPGPSNVTAILTSGTEIANINGVKIYAPEGGSSDGKIVLVDYSTVTHAELQNYLTNGNYVYIKNSSEYMLLYSYARASVSDGPGTRPYYANIYKFGCIASNASGNVQLKIYTITRNEREDSYTRELVTYSFKNTPYYAFENALADNATISSLATINDTTVYSGIIDVTNCSTFKSIKNLYRAYELYCWGEYSVGTNDYRLCKLKFTSIKQRTSSSASVEGYIFKGEIVLDDRIIILTNTLTSSGWSGQVAKQILLSDIS